MPVGQLVDFAASLCGTNPKRMHDIARRLGLDMQEILSRPFNRLSGGMKQKLLIAVALGRDAKVLVMDEPAANLDPEARHIFFQLLAERLESTTMLISSHRLDEVAPLVNRVIEMDMGKVVLDDRVADDTGLASLYNVHLTLTRPDAAIAKALGAWSFADRRDGVEWHGQVPGPDRLRFLGMISRYVGLVARIEMAELPEDLVLQ
jgi:ABC-2 type transport system ATP-binding protein